MIFSWIFLSKNLQFKRLIPDGIQSFGFYGCLLTIFRTARDPDNAIRIAKTLLQMSIYQYLIWQLKYFCEGLTTQNFGVRKQQIVP